MRLTRMWWWKKDLILTWWKRRAAFVYHLNCEMMMLLCLMIEGFFQVYRSLILVNVEIFRWVFTISLNCICYLCIHAYTHLFFRIQVKKMRRKSGNENGFSLKIFINTIFIRFKKAFLIYTKSSRLWFDTTS